MAAIIELEPDGAFDVVLKSYLLGLATAVEGPSAVFKEPVSLMIVLCIVCGYCCDLRMKL